VLHTRNGISLLTGADAPELGTKPKDVVWQASRM
jgi:hypothetical protein